MSDALRAEFGPRFVGGIGMEVWRHWPDYLDALARARIAISVRGYGYDCLRFWEIPSFDTMLVSDKLPIVKPYPFEDQVHAAYFDIIEELIAIVRRALSDPVWSTRIAKAGNEHLRTHHTARARAKQLLQASLGGVDG